MKRFTLTVRYKADETTQGWSVYYTNLTEDAALDMAETFRRKANVDAVWIDEA